MSEVANLRGEFAGLSVGGSEDGNAQPTGNRGGNDICEWYSRPDLAHPVAFSYNANVSPGELCDECKALSIPRLIGTRHRRGYTFRKTYAETNRDAVMCALCRAIEDSLMLSALYPGGRQSIHIPHENHVRLSPSINGKRLAGFVIKDRTPLVEEDIDDNEDGEYGSSDDDSISIFEKESISAASTYEFTRNPTYKGYLDYKLIQCTCSPRQFATYLSIHSILSG
jgi:hypothetical protein